MCQENVKTVLIDGDTANSSTFFKNTLESTIHDGKEEVKTSSKHRKP